MLRTLVPDGHAGVAEERLYHMFCHREICEKA
jgi:hypothetical protein